MAIVLPYRGMVPRLGRGVFLAENAVVVGDVELGDGASVWFGAVLRGDMAAIRVGARTNIQDLACLHVTAGLPGTVVGRDVTVGHGAILHACTVEDGCIIGMGAMVLDEARIGEASIVAAGALVPPRMVVPARTLVQGVPARVVRQLADDERPGIEGAAHYADVVRGYLDNGKEGTG